MQPVWAKVRNGTVPTWQSMHPVWAKVRNGTVPTCQSMHPVRLTSGMGLSPLFRVCIQYGLKVVHMLPETPVHMLDSVGILTGSIMNDVDWFDTSSTTSKSSVATWLLRFLQPPTRKCSSRYGEGEVVEWKDIAHWADEFSTNAFGEMLAIICKWRSSKNNKIKFWI